MKKISEEIKKQNLFISKDFTYEEYVNQLIELQNIVCKYAFKDEYLEEFRINDAITKVKQTAISMKLNNTVIYFKGINALKQIEKELAITFAGRKAENHVDKLLNKYVTRDDFTSYRGIYLNNGLEDTEIDNLILTKNGFLLLEIKNIKSDVQISKEGRLFVDGDCSFEQIPLGEKMKRKRNLFKSEIKKALNKKGVHIDIELQSFIVFNEPKNTRCYVNNNSDERWCKSSQIGYKVNEFYNKFPYSDEQLNILRKCCEEFETHQKMFTVNYDIEEALHDICTLFDLLNSEKENNIKRNPSKQKKKPKTLKSIMRPVFSPFPMLNATTCLFGLTLLSASIISNVFMKE